MQKNDQRVYINDSDQIETHAANKWEKQLGGRITIERFIVECNKQKTIERIHAHDEQQATDK